MQWPSVSSTSWLVTLWPRALALSTLCNGEGPSLHWLMSSHTYVLLDVEPYVLQSYYEYTFLCELVSYWRKPPVGWRGKRWKPLQSGGTNSNGQQAAMEGKRWKTLESGHWRDKLKLKFKWSWSASSNRFPTPALRSIRKLWSIRKRSRN